MNRGSAAAILFLAAGATLARAGDEPKTYEITWKARWTAGQVVTETEHETEEMETRIGEKVIKAEKGSLDATYVVRCDEVDGKGNPTRRTILVKSWKRTKGKESDESLSGLRIVVAGETWTLPEGATAAPLAEKWLKSRFGKDKNDPLTKLVPPRLEIGKAWKPDPKAAAEAFAGAMDDAPFDPAGIEMELTLASVEGTPPDETGRCLVKFHCPILEKAKGMPEGAVVLAGSAADMVGERSGPLSSSTMLGKEHMEMSVKMNLEMRAEGKQAIGFSVKGKFLREHATVSGGEIPEPTSPSPPKAPAPGEK